MLSWCTLWSSSQAVAAEPDSPQATNGFHQAVDVGFHYSIDLADLPVPEQEDDTTCRSQPNFRTSINGMIQQLAKPAACVPHMQRASECWRLLGILHCELVQLHGKHECVFQTTMPIIDSHMSVFNSHPRTSLRTQTRRSATPACALEVACGGLQQ